MKHERFLKVSASLFFIFNTFLVVLANRIAPPVGRNPVFQWTERQLDVGPPFLSKTLEQYLQKYSYFASIDIMAVMFSGLSRQEWELLILANYSDGRHVMLPLPGQPSRTFLQRIFVDHKEGKFHNNMYGFAEGQRAYSNYLCDTFSLNYGVRMQSIDFDVVVQNFLPREKAALENHYEDGPLYIKRLNTFICPQAGNPSDEHP